MTKVFIPNAKEVNEALRESYSQYSGNKIIENLKMNYLGWHPAGLNPNSSESGFDLEDARQHPVVDSLDFSINCPNERFSLILNCSSRNVFTLENAQKVLETLRTPKYHCAYFTEASLNSIEAYREVKRRGETTRHTTDEEYVRLAQKYKPEVMHGLDIKYTMNHPSDEKTMALINKDVLNGEDFALNGYVEFLASVTERLFDDLARGADMPERCEGDMEDYFCISSTREAKR